MRVEFKYLDGKLTVFLYGELDHHEIQKSAADIDQLLDDYMPRDCILDLQNLSFMDSSGIALILKLYRKVKLIGGHTSVKHIGSQPRRVLDTAGLDRLIHIHLEGEVNTL